MALAGDHGPSDPGLTLTVYPGELPHGQGWGSLPKEEAA